MNQNSLPLLKLEIQHQAKKGIDFIVAASIVWFAIYLIWNLNYPSYDRAVFTFMIGAVLLPLAFGISKLFKTNWKIKDNPLQPLGLWLNFAQLLYFPLLIFIFLKHPDYFIMAYAMITGAHLFPYAWFYDEIGYAIAAFVISVGALIIALAVDVRYISYIPLFTSIMFLFLAGWIFIRIKKAEQ